MEDHTRGSRGQGDGGSHMGEERPGGQRITHGGAEARGTEDHMGVQEKRPGGQDSHTGVWDERPGGWRVHAVVREERPSGHGKMKYI